MNKTKTHIKDGIRMGDIEYKVGDKVVLVRRKQNGYPKALDDDKLYKIDSIEKENIIIKKPKSGVHLIKIHRSYLAPLNYLRNDLIDEILCQ